jgi:hypothetical protein
MTTIRQVPGEILRSVRFSVQELCVETLEARGVVREPEMIDAKDQVQELHMAGKDVSSVYPTSPVAERSAAFLRCRIAFLPTVGPMNARTVLSSGNVFFDALAASEHKFV